MKNLLFFYFILAPRMLFFRPRESILDLRAISAFNLEVEFTRAYRSLRKSTPLPFWYCVYTSLGKWDLL